MKQKPFTYSNEDVIIALNKIKVNILNLVKYTSSGQISYDLCSAAIFSLSPDEFKVWLKFYGKWIKANPKHQFMSSQGEETPRSTGYLFDPVNYESRLTWIDKELELLKD
jgi:hypothetical protein